MDLELYYLPKKYQNSKGGRFADISKFCTECEHKKQKPDAKWTIDKTIQSIDDTSDGEAFVAISKLLENPVVLKVMVPSYLSRKEVRVNRVFRKYPHRNVVQSICDFSCLDNTIRWLSPVKAPQLFCIKGNTNFTVVVEEYLPFGDLSMIKEWKYPIWKSITLQLLFTILELFYKFGFVYLDWNLRNILLDKRKTNTKVIYNAYHTDWIVENTYGVCPVMTDFSRSDILLYKKEDSDLAIQLCYCLDMMSRVCPNLTLKSSTFIFSTEMEEIKSINIILNTLEQYINTL
jgi:serine/threonine protein kinase